MLLKDAPWIMEGMVIQLKCTLCKYVWHIRTNESKPKRCPRCQCNDESKIPAGYFHCKKCDTIASIGMSRKAVYGVHRTWCNNCGADFCDSFGGEE
jgi:protein-arginine kinase activator protein McsA